MSSKLENIDVLVELEPYMDKFERSKIDDGKLNSCSPFRIDKKPSFVIWLDHGNWVDSGTGQKGSFIELLSFLSGDEPEDIRDHLFKSYGRITDTDTLLLKLNLELLEKDIPHVFENGLPKEFRFRHPYLTERGISEKVQRACKIGYDKCNRAVVIPWMNKNGEIIRLQFRSVNSKMFWFSEEGQRIKHHLFGLNHVINRQDKVVWIVEAPIDALYLWSNEIPAVATGSATISKEQIKLLKHTGIQTLVLATDNDTAGGVFKEKLKKHFTGNKELFDFQYPTGIKDVNEIPAEALKRLTLRPVVYKFIKN